MTRHPLPLAVTMGEPAGIGGELTLKAWQLRRQDRTSAFVAFDDPDRLRTIASELRLDVPVRPLNDIARAGEIFGEALPVLPVPLAARPVNGKLDPANAPATIDSIMRAVAATRSGEAGAVVTNPIQKSVLKQAGFAHPGHTEYLAALSAAPGAEPPPVAMMLACPQLRVVPITIHMALRQVFDVLTSDLIVQIGTIAGEAMRRDFGLPRPRLGIAGLNPHAGEAGTMGNEEQQIIQPAIEKLRQCGFDVSGPWPPDTMFHAAARERYDVALCMYHDQALIPIKTIDFSGGVNVTLGLPFVRTSPDHGTALDIAGTGKADPTSFLAALDLAATLAQRRAKVQ